MNRHLVYCLIDPRYGTVRYVGKSSTGMKRPARHKTHYGRIGNTHNKSWLRQMWADGETLPSILVLQECESEAEALACEVQLIARFRAAEFNLTNLTDGGEGCAATPETRAKLSASGKGRVCTPETRARLSAARMGHVVSIETRAKIAVAHRGKVVSPETRAKISAIYTPEVRAKLSVAAKERAKGRVISPELRAKMSAASKGRACSPETRAKISAANTGRVRSPETRAKLSAVWTPERHAKHIDLVRTPESRAKTSAALKGRVVSAETCARISATKLRKNKERREAQLTAERKACTVPPAQETRKESES